VLRKVAEMESIEARYAWQNGNYQRGGLVIRAPNADIGRDPRWGRTEESYGEDAFFNGTMAVAFIKGLQGEDPKYWRTAALMKHFLANSNENGRDSSSSDFDERLFREYYSLPFYMGVRDGGSRAYMAAYNSYNGTPMTVHPVLKDITVTEWGQNGIICTDGGAFKMLVNSHRAFPNLYTAGAATIKAGINQYLDDYKEGIYGALANGYLTEREIEEVIKGNFRVMIKLGLWDPEQLVPYSQIGQGKAPEPWLTDASKAAVREVTRKTAVLLKNTKNALPLNAQRLKSVAVIGSNANDVFLDWYSGTPPYTVPPLQGIRNKLGSSATVRYARTNQADSAVTAAQASDVAIVVVGNHPYCNTTDWKKCETASFGKEAVDRQTITLEEEELIKQVYAANPNTIVVLISSFPYALNWSQANVPAILHLTHNSQELGNALADVLFGDYNPGGKLVQTWPKSLDQLPDMMDYNIRNGRTYMYAKSKPLYPFGFGLSYTSFKLSNLKTSAPSLNSKDELTVSVEVQNTGTRAGDEVVQLYVQHIGSKVARPLKELKGFRRVTVPAGLRKTVQLTLKAQDLAFWDEKAHAFVVEPGRLLVGNASDNLKLQQKVKVTK